LQCVHKVFVFEWFLYISLIWINACHFAVPFSSTKSDFCSSNSICVFFHYIGFACSAVPFLKEQHSDLCCSFFKRTILLRFSLFLLVTTVPFPSKKQRSFIAVVSFSTEWHVDCFIVWLPFLFPKGTAFAFFFPFSIIHRCCFSNGTPLAYFWSLLLI